MLAANRECSSNEAVRLHPRNGQDLTEPETFLVPIHHEIKDILDASI